MNKLDEILEHYSDSWQVDCDIQDIRDELMANDVEVCGDSYFCPIWKDEVNGYVLLAGTKDKADMWVLKKIIKLIKTGKPIYSMLNGNSTYLMKVLERYDVKLERQDGDIVYLSFNTGE